MRQPWFIPAVVTALILGLLIGFNRPQPATDQPWAAPTAQILPSRTPTIRPADLDPRLFATPTPTPAQERDGRPVSDLVPLP